MQSIDFASTPNDHVGYAVSVDRLFKTMDSGASWAPIDVPQVKVQRVAVDKVNPDRVYVHSESTAHLSTDGGSTWSPGATAVDVRLLYAAAPNKSSTLFATGYHYLYRSTDGGLNYQRITPVNCTSCTQRAELHPATGRLWVSTEHNGPVALPWTLHYSDDDGVNWTEVSTPAQAAPTADGMVTSLQEDDLIAYWRSSPYGPSGQNAGIQLSVDAGQTWSTVTDPGLNLVQSRLAIVGPPSARQFIAGYHQINGYTDPEGPFRGPIVFSSSDGATWTEIDELSDHRLLDVMELSDSWVASTGVGFYRSLDQVQWSRSSHGINTAVRQVNSAGALLALTEEPAPDVLVAYECKDGNSYIVPSRDGGRTVERGIVTDPLAWIGVNPHDAESWAHSGYAGPRSSSDAGRTWQVAQPRFRKLWYHPTLPLIYTESRNEVLLSDDGGTTFSHFFTEPMGEPISSVVVTRDSAATVLVITNSAIWALDENGQLLPNQPVLPPSSPSRIAAVKYPQPLLFSNGFSPYASTDGGQTWTRLTGLPPFSRVLPVWDPNRKALLVGTPDGLYNSEDGFAWSPTGELQGFDIQALAANSYGHLVAATTDHGVWVYNDPMFFGDFETGDLRHWTSATP